MAPLRSIAGRSLGKLLEGFKTSTLGQGFGSGGGTSLFTATGGDIENIKEPGNGYVYHTFGTSGDFQVITGDSFVDILVVAGGGGGGGRAGGGGGAGGIVYVDSVPLSTGTYPVVVGPGGAGAGQPGHPQYPSNESDSPNVGQPGSNSYFGEPGVSIGGQPSHFLARGGGGGGKASSPSSYGDPGGSSGGSGYGEANPQTADQPGTNPSPFATDYGNKGGRGLANPTYNCGGGGGAGGVGGPGVPKNGDGGIGQPFPEFAYPLCFPSIYLPGFATPGNPLPTYNPSSTESHYGGGGGGGGHPPQGPQGGGGIGGGGQGGNPGGPFPQGASAAGTSQGINYLGGGGGGTTTGGGNPQNYWGQPGGKGVVIIRYQKN